VFFLRQFKSWPDAGGWADQDAHLLEDIETFVRVERRAAWEAKHGIRGGHEELGEGPKKKLF
jgi:hypothetical protein